MPSHTYVYTNMRPNIYKKVKKKKTFICAGFVDSRVSRAYGDRKPLGWCFFFFCELLDTETLRAGVLFFLQDLNLLSSLRDSANENVWAGVGVSVT
jgi:hypothetical protein